MTRTTPYLSEAEQYAAHNYAPLPVVLARGEGAYVWDVEGRRYLDLVSAYSALNHGHGHPRIVRALTEQAERLTLTSRAVHNNRMGPFLHQLCDLTGYEQALPMNTGAEAVETAVKASRKWGYEVKGIPEDEAEIVVFDGNFHGRTTTLVGLSSEPLYRRGFGPFAPGFRRVPYGDLSAVEGALSEWTAAVLVEPIQGEAGIIVPPEGFLRGLDALCRERDVLLVADEVQTGLGRTGRLLACDWEDVRPDVLILGKALGGGVYPVSAILADRAVMNVFTPGTHGSTFSGNPLAAAVGQAALDVLTEEHLPERADALGTWFMEELRTLESPVVREVRGRGLLIGIEIAEAAGSARALCERMLERGLLVKDTHDRVVRLAPPLVVTREQLEAALVVLRDVLEGEPARSAFAL